MKLTEDERSMFADAYRFFEQYKGEVHSAEDWVKAAKTAEQICAKHDNSELMSGLLAAVYHRIEDIYKEGCNSGG